jgi:hypothetical protein
MVHFQDMKTYEKPQNIYNVAFIFSSFQSNHAFVCYFEQMMQDEMLNESACADGNDFMTGLEDLICRDDAAMSAIW